MLMRSRFGDRRTRNSEKGKVASHYFDNLFTSTYSESINSCLQGFQVKVSSSMNQDLTKPATEEEVQNVIFLLTVTVLQNRMDLRLSFFNNIGHWLRHKS